MSDTNRRGNAWGFLMPETRVGIDCERCRDFGWIWQDGKLVVCPCGKAKIPGGWQRPERTTRA